jgi:SNF2 family DNA or RNA helicase
MSGNGLLGDEMGLGKTVQVGALLEAMRGVRRRALIVTTSSTLYNWQSELSRWAP